MWDTMLLYTQLVVSCDSWYWQLCCIIRRIVRQIKMKCSGHAFLFLWLWITTLRFPMSFTLPWCINRLDASHCACPLIGAWRFFSDGTDGRELCGQGGELCDDPLCACDVRATDGWTDQLQDHVLPAGRFLLQDVHPRRGESGHVLRRSGVRNPLRHLGAS